MRKVLFAAVFVLVGLAPAKSAWLFQNVESAFGGDNVAVMINQSGRYFLGFRCEGGELSLLYMTKEKMSELDSLNSLNPIVLFRVDKNEVHELKATARSNENEELMLFAPVTAEIVLEIQAGKKRAAVVLDVMGQRFHEANFSLDGSSKTSKQLLESCKP